MAKGGLTEKLTLFLVLVAVALGIASVILNIVILNKKAKNSTNYVYGPTDPPVTDLPETSVPAATTVQKSDATSDKPPNTLKQTQNAGTTLRPSTDAPIASTTWSSGHQQCYQVSNSPGFKEAADNLLYGIDFDYDPCEDFYMFTCGNFLKKTKLSEGQARNGTYDMSQAKIFRDIAKTTENLPTNVSKTEEVFKYVYESCYNSFNSNSSDKSLSIYKELILPFGGFPALVPNWKSINTTQLWTLIATYESSYAIPSLLQSLVSVDYMNNSENALYVYQGPLQNPRDFYVKPQFLSDINSYLSQTIASIQLYNKLIGGNTSEEINDYIKQEITKTIAFEVDLALAMVPDDLMRNYKQQYNPFSVSKLQTSYKNIEWSTYFQTLLSEVDPNFIKDRFVIGQPAFLRALDDMLEQYDMSTIVNFVVLRLIQGTSEFIGGESRDVMRAIKNAPKTYVDADDEAVQGCMGFLLTYMPYGIGYTYIKHIPEKYEVRDDVNRMTKYIIDAFVNMTETLTWMTPQSEAALKVKRANLVNNTGWPHWFMDFSPQAENISVDPYHRLYMNLTQINQSDYFHIYLGLSKAYQLTENFKLLEQAPDRHNFLQSPAMVNAWYIPERNSITFPYAAFNPPYYRLDFPQAYNYAGQGGTAGHELTHGYDDEGVQFGPTGMLSDCQWNRCGWMDMNSTLGFIDMAQCVVSQYSSQCCPMKTGSVHCANGATTQGENIADLGGQQSAYKGYRKYVEEVLNGVEEPRLPGLEQFTPNQIFWITYGYSWCMQQSTKSLVTQLLTNPHAPGSCRVNQVMQDVPEFGRDFNCKKGSSSLYPSDQQRCKVWTGI